MSSTEIILIEDRMPEPHVTVVLWLRDPRGSAHCWPITAFNNPEFDKPMWWGGFPGSYQRIGRLDGEWPKGWMLVGWTPLPDNGDVREALELPS